MNILPCCFVISFLICNNVSQNSLLTPLITFSIFTTVILEIRTLIAYLSFWKVLLNCQSSLGKAQSFVVRQQRQSGGTQHVFTLFGAITSHCLICTFESSFIESFDFLLTCYDNSSLVPILSLFIFCLDCLSPPHFSG